MPISSPDMAVNNNHYKRTSFWYGYWCLGAHLSSQPCLGPVLTTAVYECLWALIVTGHHYLSGGCPGMPNQSIEGMMAIGHRRAYRRVKCGCRSVELPDPDGCVLTAAK